MRWPCAFGLCVFTACGPAAERDNDKAIVTDSAGVEIVTSYGAQWAADSGWRVDSMPVTSIGGDERDRQQHFKWVMAARRLSDGRVVIATDVDVRWFAADGRYLLTTSRAGDGPGELRALRTLHRTPGDSIVAADAMGRRVATFGPDGALVRDERLDGQRFAARGRWEECDTALLPDGSRYVCKSDPSIPVTSSNRPGRHVSKEWTSPGRGRLRQLKRTFVIPPSLDTAYPLGVTAGPEQFGVDIGSGRIASVIHPFHSSAILAGGGSPMRIVMMLNPEYRIEVWTPTGKLERIIRRGNARRVPTAAERADARAAMRERQRHFMDPISVERVLNAVPEPDSLPAAVAILATDEGEIVVQREGWLPSQRASIFDVFDVKGQWLGELRLGPRTVIHEVGRDYITTVRYDEDDLPHVEVLRLRRSTAVR